MTHPIAQQLRELAPKCSAYASACPATMRQAADIVDAAAEALKVGSEWHTTEAFVTAIERLEDAFAERTSLSSPAAPAAEEGDSNERPSVFQKLVDTEKIVRDLRAQVTRLEAELATVRGAAEELRRRLCFSVPGYTTTYTAVADFDDRMREADKEGKHG